MRLPPPLPPSYNQHRGSPSISPSTSNEHKSPQICLFKKLLLVCSTPASRRHKPFATLSSDQSYMSCEGACIKGT
ncbi:hypothetical protein AALP_AAs61751U000100 [Arabis alpina]|uniref:Uncharacterized protein n=1 Tax=Arabis alpina TaxID=50452 RepID=A0A087G2N7_ARAAL|nr:hypothetical protein AALP_AAs61751U000100 [Arabis alpina]